MDFFKNVCQKPVQTNRNFRLTALQRLLLFRHSYNSNAQLVEQIDWHSHHKQRECIGGGGDDGSSNADGNNGVAAVSGQKFVA